MHDGRGEKIRLYGVDCPEKSQDFGIKAKQFTSGMVSEKVVDVYRYGKLIGLVKIAGKYLSEEIIRTGLGWARYCENRSVLSGII